MSHGRRTVVLVVSHRVRRAQPQSQKKTRAILRCADPSGVLLGHFARSAPLLGLSTGKLARRLALAGFAQPLHAQSADAQRVGIAAAGAGAGASGPAGKVLGVVACNRW